MAKIIVLLLLITTQVSAQELNLNKIRKEYSVAVKDEDVCVKNLELLREKAKSTTEKGYLSVYEMVYAKHMGNPFKKLSQFKKGKSLLENVIATDGTNVELRFIRWSVQTHAPGILNYSSNIATDKKFIVENFSKLKDDTVKDIIYKYIKGANSFSEGELKEMLN